MLDYERWDLRRMEVWEMMWVIGMYVGYSQSINHSKLTVIESLYIETVLNTT